jgi:hypothetical protein
MNYFLFVLSILYLGAAGWEYVYGSKLMAVIICRGPVSNLALAAKA